MYKKAVRQQKVCSLLGLTVFLLTIRFFSSKFLAYYKLVVKRHLVFCLVGTGNLKCHVVNNCQKSAPILGLLKSICLKITRKLGILVKMYILGFMFA